MGVATTVVMMGMAIASGAAAYSSSRTQAKRAEAQAKIAGKQGDIELRRSAQSAEEAMRELEDAREYQQWKEEFVVPALEKSLSDPVQDDPSRIRATQDLGRGIQVEEAQDVVAQGITGAGFDFGGTRHSEASRDILQGAASESLAGLGAAHELVRQQGIANRGQQVQAGRQVYKQQGII